MIDRRVRYRQGLNSLYLPYYDALCALMPADWAPYDGIRTFAEQDAEYAKGRTVKGGIVTNAKGGESPHEYGCANDWTRWTEAQQPIWMGKTDLAWQILINAAEKVGLRSGSEFGDVDHVELKISVSWKNQILPAFQSGGMDAAQAAISAAMV